MTENTFLLQVRTEVLTNVKYSKVYALAFTYPMDKGSVCAFAIPKLQDPNLLGSAIVPLTNLSTGVDYHNGETENNFVGVLTKAFTDTYGNVTTDSDASISNVFFITTNGNNETVTGVYTPDTIQPTTDIPINITATSGESHLTNSIDSETNTIIARNTSPGTSHKFMTNIEIPLSEFSPSFRGRSLRMGNFNHDSLTEIGILIGNKIEENFILIIDSISIKSIDI